MKKTLFLLALFCFILQKPPLEKPAEAQRPAALVVDAGRYAWAWADARYYTCFAPPEKAAY